MIKDLNTIKDRVEVLLDNHESTRDSDKLLWLAYMVTFHDLKEVIGEESYFKFKELLLRNDTPVMESVRRIRQKFQEDGKYLAKPTVAAARSYEERQVREWVK